MRKKSFYAVIVPTLFLLLLAGCAAAGGASVSSGADGELTSAEPAATVSAVSVADNSSVDTGAETSVGAGDLRAAESPDPSTVDPGNESSSSSKGWALKTVSEEGYVIRRVGFCPPWSSETENVNPLESSDPLESYEGEIKLLTDKEFSKLYPNTYESPSSADTGWIIISGGPFVVKVGEKCRIPSDILASIEVSKRHIHVADWKISDTSVLKILEWDSQKGCNVEALKTGKVKVTMTVKMNDGRYKKSTTVYVIGEDEPLPVKKYRIWTPPTEEERQAMQPSSVPAETSEPENDAREQEPFSSRGTSF